MPVNIWNILSLNPLLFQSCKGYLTHFYLCPKVISVPSGLYLLLDSDWCLLSHPANRLFLEKVDSSANISTVVGVKLLFPLTCPSSSPHPWKLNWWEIWVQLYLASCLASFFQFNNLSSITLSCDYKRKGKIFRWPTVGNVCLFFVLNSLVCCF